MVEGQENRQSLTPTTIRNTEPSRGWLRGYRRDDVHRLLDDVADELAAAIRERDELASRVESLETEAERHRELEAALSSALVSAEQAANEAKAQARRESDLIIREAHADARRTVREAAAERRQLEDGITELRARIRSLLGLLEASELEDSSAAAPPDSAEQPSLSEALESGVREVLG
jgi:cell division initiation protein